MRWLRDLLRDQAAGGRTVLVSSHLLSEIAQTAEELVVIRKGKLVAQTSLAEFTAGGPGSVRVRASDIAGLGEALGELEGSLSPDGDGGLLVSGIDGARIGEIALRRGIAIHELAPQQQSLEERFFELMGDEEDGA
jgi:ABC-2 type transport system ATP-binding protein